MIYVRNDRYVGVGGYDSWWDVPPAEVSEMESVRKARKPGTPRRSRNGFFCEASNIQR